MITPRNARAPLVGLVILVVGAFGVLFYLLSQGSTVKAVPVYTSHAEESADPLVTKVVPNQQALTTPTISSTDPVRGNPGAAVHIVVFSDFSCPYCATLAADLKKLVETRKDVAVVWKDFPISGLHPETLQAHVAARCAASQGKFWEYHDRLFAAQGTFTRDNFLAMAQRLGLHTDQFDACLDSPTPLLLVQQDVNEGNALGIDGTPFLFIDDQKISGVVSFEELSRAVDIHAAINQKK